MVNFIEIIHFIEIIIIIIGAYESYIMFTILDERKKKKMKINSKNFILITSLYWSIVETFAEANFFPK